MSDATPSPIDEEQLQLLLESIANVAGSPDGCGEVVVTIKAGKVTFISPQPRLDARSHAVARERIWLHREEQTRREHR